MTLPTSNPHAAPTMAAGRARLLPVIDVEASGFGRGSYPIEVGWVGADGVAQCRLIRPEPDWTHWDASAERIHRIDPATLRTHGRPAAEVALALNGALAGRVVYCDGWAQDYAWLARLFDAAAMTPLFRLESVHALLPDAATQAALHASHRAARAALGSDRHRASADARALQQALAAVLGSSAAPATPRRAQRGVLPLPAVEPVALSDA